MSLGALATLVVVGPFWFLTDSTWPIASTIGASTDEAGGADGPVATGETDVTTVGDDDGDDTSTSTDERPTTSTGDDFPNRPPALDDVMGDASDGDVTLELGLVDPSAVTRGRSLVQLRLDSIGNQVCYEMDTTGIRAPYPAAIHRGLSGQDGPVVVDLGSQPSSTLGCVDADPAVLGSIVADPAGHYLAFDDPNMGISLRSQLAAASFAVDQGMLDPDGGGATVVVTDGAVTLQGTLPDYDTRTWFHDLFAGAILADEMTLIDDTTVLPDAPLPSGRIFLRDELLFDVGSSALVDSDSRVIRQLAAILISRPEWQITVVGHTDDVGDEASNAELSLQRAASVRDALIAAGVDPDALTIDGAGSSQPVADNATAEGRALNRRIELEISPAA